MKIENYSIISVFVGTICTICPNWIAHHRNFIIPTKVLLFWSVLITMFATPLFAANQYVRSGGSSGTGTSWNDSYQSLPATLVRGNTYYIAGGTYSGRTFDTATSAMSVITIKGATVADHGTDTGWNNIYSVENTQAIWTSGLLFTSSYWVFDGSVGSMTKTASAYGFSFGTSLSGIVTIGNTVGPSYTDITISHVYAKATTSDVEKLFLQNGYQVGAINSVTVSHSLLDGWQNGMTAQGQGGAACNNWKFEYNMALNGFSSASHHGEWINSNSAPLSNAIIRYNLFQGSNGGQTGTIVANNATNSGAMIYGNIFDSLSVGNGVISGTSTGNLNNAVVYNNTFLNCSVATNNPIGGTGQGSGNVAYNNLIYNMSAGIGGGFTSDYNAYFIAIGAPSEVHGQRGSSNPFINSAGGNYKLTSATIAGIILPPPYNTDMDSKTRGADGVWGRGAFESVNLRPSPPVIKGVTQ